MGMVSASPENVPAIVDISDNDTEVYGSPAQLVGVHVHTTLSAHDCPIKDGGTSGDELFNIPASTLAGTWLEGGNMRYSTTLHVDPNDAATGQVTVVYIPNLEGLAGDGINA